MKENLVSLAKLLATDDTFNLAFSSQGTNEEKYELVKTKFADLTREDFSEFLEKLCEAEKNSLASCSPDELEMITGGMRGWVIKTAAITVIATALGATGVMSINTDAMKPGYCVQCSTSPSAVAANKQKSKSQTTTKPKAPHPVTEVATSPKPKKRTSSPAAAAAGTPLSAQKQWHDTRIIRLGPPRSSEVILKFDHGDKSALEVLQAHLDNNRVYGSSSLIGELAQIVESYLVERRSDPKNPNRRPLKLCDITFKFGLNNDIVAHQCGAYNGIIEKMISSTSATPTSRPASSQAAKILESLKYPNAAEESAPKSTASEPEKELPRRELDFPKAAEILVALAHSKLEPPIPASEPDPKKLAEEKHQSKSTASEPAEELSTPEPEVSEAAEMSARSKSHLQEEAEKILKNLSKPCKIPDEIKKDIKADNGRYKFDFDKLTIEHIKTLACELFEGLDNGSKDLVAVFLCECIRFNDDGALVRWSIRKFIQNCEQGSPRKEIRRMYAPKSPNPSLLHLSHQKEECQLQEFFLTAFLRARAKGSVVDLKIIRVT